MPRSGIRGSQIIDGTVQSIDIENESIWKEDLNTTSTGKAVITRVLPGDDISIDYTGVDEGTGEVTINFNSSTGGITASTHRSLDQLVHEIAEDAYCEIERTSGRVSAIYYYEDNSKVTLIRSFEYTRTAGRITEVVAKQYDSGGSVIAGEILTGTITRSGGRVSSIDWVRT
jgi:hypothetical protein